MTGGARVRPRGQDFSAWLPAPRWRALRCAVRGHRWASQPTARGIVLVLCGRCREVVTARFIDVADVIGAVPSTDLRSVAGRGHGGALRARPRRDSRKAFEQARRSRRTSDGWLTPLLILLYPKCTVPAGR